MAAKIKKLMPRAVFYKLEKLYQEMQESYDRVASGIDFTCDGCPDNCCNSFFRHHTRVEWAYFWKGLEQCRPEIRREIVKRAGEYVEQMRTDLSQGRDPMIMCPVNFDGWCVLYRHRLMICRLHGVPSTHSTPGGQSREFPGCFRCREETEHLNHVPRVDRTRFYHQLAWLEQSYVGPRIVKMDKVDLTLAEMIVHGPPFKW